MTTNNLPRHDFKDLGSPVTKDFLARYADDGLILDCPQIMLRQCSTEAPRVFNGRGMIMLKDAYFQLRMYLDSDQADAVPHPFDLLLQAANWKSGEIIPPDNYYELTATDLSGYAWTCRKLEINVHSAGHGAVVTGHLYDTLVHKAAGLPAISQSHLSMYFFEDLPVPFNRFVEVERRAGGRVLALHAEPFAEVSTGAFTFKVESTESAKGLTIVRVSLPEVTFPEGIETRIEESLRYVTMRPVRWGVVEKRQGGMREVTVVPKAELNKPIFDEPLDHRRHAYAEDYWQLFAAYFQYTLTCKDSTNYHPISAHLFHVISSGTKQLDLTGLIVSVAVEGVLNVAFCDLAKPTQGFRDGIDKVGRVIGRMSCTDTALANRLRGALSQMKSARAKDKLKLLVEYGVVTDDQVTAWSTLRNKTAHAAVRIDPTVSQALFGQCNMVYTMLNRLVFQAIGYSGQYQDFSTLGWPIDRYDAKRLA